MPIISSKGERARSPSVPVLIFREDLLSRVVGSSDIESLLLALRSSNTSSLSVSQRRRLSKLIRLGVLIRDGNSVRLRSDPVLIASVTPCSCGMGLRISNFIVISSSMLISLRECDCDKCPRDKYVVCVRCVKSAASSVGVKLRSIRPIDAWREIIMHAIAKTSSLLSA